MAAYLVAQRVTPRSAGTWGPTATWRLKLGPGRGAAAFFGHGAPPTQTPKQIVNRGGMGTDSVNKCVKEKCNMVIFKWCGNKLI